MNHTTLQPPFSERRTCRRNHNREWGTENSPTPCTTHVCMHMEYIILCPCARPPTSLALETLPAPGSGGGRRGFEWTFDLTTKDERSERNNNKPAEEHDRQHHRVEEHHEVAQHQPQSRRAPSATASTCTHREEDNVEVVTIVSRCNRVVVNYRTTYGGTYGDLPGGWAETQLAQDPKAHRVYPLKAYQQDCLPNIPCRTRPTSQSEKPSSACTQ